MQKVIKGTTPTFYGYPPVLGQASSASYRIVTPAVGLPSDDDWTAVAGGDLPALSGTLTLATERGSRDLAFDAGAPAFVVGERIFWANTSGQSLNLISYTMTVIAVEGNFVTVESPVPSNLTATLLIKDYGIPVTLTAEQTATAGMRALIKWRAVIDGETYDWDQAFHVVDEVIEAPLTTDELQELWPEARKFIASEDFGLNKAINAAWVLIVYPELQGRGVRGDLINNVTPLKPVLVAAVKYLSFSSRFPADIVGITAKHEDFNHALSLALAGPDWWAASNDSEDTSADVGTSEPFARIRRVR